MKKPEKLTLNGEKIVLDINHISYEDLQGIERFLGFGIIIESGENENGHYIKYGDGTQICWINIVRTDIAINNEYGSLFTSNWTWTFPQPFIERPTVPSPTMRWGTSGSWGIAAQSTNTGVQLFIIDALTRPSGANVVINAIAIGRWK